MARQLRIEYPGAFYHVMNRGADRKRIFHDKSFCHMFLEILEELNNNFHIKIHAYCLMGNHYHLLIETPLGNLSKAMRHLNGVYTQRHNRLLKKDGPLFRGRFKAILVDAENYLLQVSRYIHLNPVQASLVEKPQDYLWSSFKYYCSPDIRHAWLCCDEILDRFNKSKTHAYKNFVNEGIDAKTQKLYTAAKMPFIFGEDSFYYKIKENLKIEANKDIPDSKRFSETYLSVNDIVREISTFYKCTPNDIIEGKNPLLKKLLVYFCKMYTSTTQHEIGKFLGIGHSGISQICKRLSMEINENKELQKMIDNLDCLLSKVKT